VDEVLDANKRLSTSERRRQQKQQAADFEGNKKLQKIAASRAAVKSPFAPTPRGNSERSTIFRQACMSMMIRSLTSVEITSLHEAFVAMEASNDGAVTLDELRWALTEKVLADKAEDRCARAQQAPAEVDELHATSHEDVHPAIFEEFLATMASTKIQIRDSLLRWTFLRFDIDSSGFITVENLRSVLGARYGGASVEELAAELDADGDGRISYEEFADFFQSDGDGDEAEEAQQKVVAADAAPRSVCCNCQKSVSPGIRFCSLSCKEQSNEMTSKEEAARKKKEDADRKAQEKKAKAEADRKARVEAERSARESSRAKERALQRHKTTLEQAKCIVCKKQLRSAHIKFCSLDCKEESMGTDVHRAASVRW
jgi:Ca2+-binding EF-hand superfamily protein